VVDGAPGVYALGLPFMRRRKSSFIHGVGDDVRELAVHLAAHLDQGARMRRHTAPAAAAPAGPGAGVFERVSQATSVTPHVGAGLPG
jgi:hypothetical protein